MKMLTEQQIFNKVAKGLLKQNARSKREDDGGYPVIDDNGKRCAMGMLLPSKEPLSSHDPLPLRLAGIEPWVEANLLFALQECHDENKPSRWPRVLRRIAREHELKIPEFLQC